MSEIIASRTREYTMPSGRVYVAEAKLHKLDGNARPYFSLTGEEWKNGRALARHRDTGSETGLESCGAIGDKLVRVMPSLAIIERLHLADDTGAPMHAEANGWYWYADYDGKGTGLYPHNEPMYSMTPHERAAHYLRVEPDALPQGMTREEFAAYIETLRPQWQQEADAALAWLREA